MCSEHSPQRFHERCAQFATDVPDRPAIVTSHYTLTYGDLLRRILTGTASLARRGIEPGAIVGLTISDEAEHLIASLSLFAMGCTHIILASHDHPDMRADIARRSGVTHWIAENPALIAGHKVIAWTGDPEPENAAAAAISMEQGGLFLRTSGTTGTTNIIPFSETMIGLQADRHPEYAEDHLLSLAAIEHNNAKRHRLYCTWNGGTNVFIDHRADDLADFITDKGVTCINLSRMHAEGLPHLHDAARLAPVKLSTGGSMIPHATRSALENSVSTKLYVRYGASEIGSITMALPGEHDEQESAGRPVAGVELLIVDESGAPLPQGQYGRIAIRAPGMAGGYLDNPEQTAKRFSDGWFYPGDMGFLRADGHLIVQGRQDEMIIMNGLNIYPKEIEAVLESHPDVAEAAAFGFPSRIHGQIPVAAIELASASGVTGPELIRWAHSSLGLRTPKRIVIVEALPRNSQGKVTKKSLLPLFAPK